MAGAESGGREAARPADLWQARCLLRAARQATLGTQTGGQPFTALVTPATAPDLSVLLLLSSLSEHTRHLQAEPRCALMVAGAAEGANPQTAPRLTVTGLAEQVEDAGLKARWLAVHPYAAPYAAFADFALWQMRPSWGLFVGGFARARRLHQAELAADPQAVARIGAAAAEIMSHCNTDHAEAIAELAGGQDGWRMVAVDCDGCDLARGEVVRRVAWSAPVADAACVRAELIRLLRRARLPRD